MKLYQALVGEPDSDKGRRVSIYAPDIQEAKRLLEEEYGEGNVVSVWNEEDASKPRV